VKTKIENFQIVEQINGFELSSFWGMGMNINFSNRDKESCHLRWRTCGVVEIKHFTVNSKRHRPLQTSKQESFFILFQSSWSKISVNVHCNTIHSSFNTTVHLL